VTAAHAAHDGGRHRVDVEMGGNGRVHARLRARVWEGSAGQARSVLGKGNVFAF
jgi:hypothetical protein